jgi:predicted dehydrogenase
MLVNAGEIPTDFWMHDPESGGGRMIGEGCHFIDLARRLVGSPITTVQANMFGLQGGRTRDDKMTVSLSFADGSIATVHYWSNGPKSFPKERVEIFSEGRVLTIDNWRRLVAYNWPGAARLKTRIDKGHRAEIALFLERVARGGEPLIPFEELDEVTRASFAAARAAQQGVVIQLGGESS